MATALGEPAQLLLGKTQAVERRHIEVSNAAIEGAGQQALAGRRIARSHQTAAAKPQPGGFSAARQSRALHGPPLALPWGEGNRIAVLP